MLAYTRASLTIIFDSFKKWVKALKIIASIITVGYFICALILKLGNFYINIVLASLFVLYTLFQLITIKMKLKKAKKIVKKSYNWVKLTIKLISLGATIYGMYEAATNVKAISIILAILMIIIWVFQFVFELIVDILEPKIQLVITGINKDIEESNALQFALARDVQDCECVLETRQKELAKLEPVAEEIKQKDEDNKAITSGKRKGAFKNVIKGLFNKNKK